LTYGTGRILLATADRGEDRCYGALDCLLFGAVANRLLLAVRSPPSVVLNTGRLQEED